MLGEDLERMFGHDPRHPFGVHLRQQRLADARGMHQRQRARREEGADALMGFDLADKEHRAAPLDAQVRGLPGRLHQPAQDRAGAFHEARAPQEARADDIGARADEPDLVHRVEIDDAAPFQRDEDAVDRGRRLVERPGEVRQRQPLMRAQIVQHRHRPVERLDGVLAGLVGPVARPAAGAAGARFGGIGERHGAPFCKIEIHIHHMKNITP